MTDFFSVKKAMQKQGEKKETKKQSKEVPAMLKPVLGVYVACKRIMKTLEPKLNLAESRIKDFAVREWATEFVRTGAIPSSSTLSAGDVSIDFVPTKRIFLKAEAVQQLEAMNVAIMDYVEVTGIDLNVEVLRKHGMLEKAQEALMKIEGMTPEIMDELVRPKMEAKETLYPSLAKISRDSLPATAKESEIIERAIAVVKIVNPVSQMRNPSDPRSLGESMNVVEGTEIDSVEDIAS
jgi:hypothetical protein